MKSWLNDLGKHLLESRGRSQSALRYPFPDNEIVSQAYLMNVSPWFNGYYLNLHPSQYGLAITPDGKVINVKGGYNALLPGRYILHYVDKQNRVSVIPRISETTIDGAKVSLEVVITYRVIDPFLALEVQQPVSTFVVFIQSDLKEFVRTHKYDEIVGDSNGHTIENGSVVRYIKEQHAGRKDMSRLFYIAEVVVEDKTGDPKLTEIRGNFQVKQKQNVAESELLKQNQDLERKVAAQDAEIKKIKARSEAAQQEILQQMELQNIELERERAELRFRQEKMMRAMDAIAQAFSTPTYPRDPREVEIIRELLGALGSSSGSKIESAAVPEHPGLGAAKSSNAEKIDSLTNTLLSWLDRKRS